MGGGAAGRVCGAGGRASYEGPVGGWLGQKTVASEGWEHDAVNTRRSKRTAAGRPAASHGDATQLPVTGSRQDRGRPRRWRATVSGPRGGAGRVKRPDKRDLGMLWRRESRVCPKAQAPFWKTWDAVAVMPASAICDGILAAISALTFAANLSSPMAEEAATPASRPRSLRLPNLDAAFERSTSSRFSITTLR